MSIVVTDLHKSYDRTVALRGVSFRVEMGEILGLVGPNGAGKTTLMRTLAGILAPTRGRLVVAGHDVIRDPLAAKAALAYVPDDPSLFESLTVWEHLRFAAAAYRVADWTPKAEALLDQFELTPKRDALASELSRGMRQKLAIGCACLHEPRAVLLDEPFSGLDPRGIRALRDAIRQRAAAGAAVVVSSHWLGLVTELCTTVLLLHQGRVVLHQPAADLRGDVLEDLFCRLTEAPAADGAPVALAHDVEA